MVARLKKTTFIWAKAKSAQREGQELSNKAPHKLLALLGQEFHEKICKEKSYVLSKITVWTACFFMPVTALMCMSVKNNVLKRYFLLDIKISCKFPNSSMYTSEKKRS